MSKLHSFIHLLLLVCLSVPVKADYIFWQGTSSNEWHLAGNWSPAVVPGPEDIAVIDRPTVDPILMTATVIGGIRITGGSLTIAAGGILNLRGLSEIYAGALVNNGTLRHETETGSGPPALFIIWDTGKLVNSGAMVFRNDYNILLRGNSTTEALVNNADGVIELYGNQAGLGAYFEGMRSIINRGTIFYKGTGLFLNLNDVAHMTFTNSGRIVATGSGISNAEGNQIINESCGIIDLRGTANYANGSGITNNAGLILMEGGLTNSSTFLNTGVVRAASFSTYTNQGLQINNSSTTQIFDYGSSNSYAVNGIYKDSSNVNVAGVFTAPNNFAPNSPQTQLYALTGNGTCTFYVPFLLDPGSLPVKLASFGISREGHHANLSWTTTSENNSSHFEVEHSTDAKNWQNIGNVPSQGESSVLQTYNYTHTNIYTGNNYYRLKMVDWDDSFAYSRIVSAEADDIGQVAGNFYPNPATGSATIDLNIDRAGNWTISTSDLTGRIIYRDTRRLDTGINKVSVPQTGSGLRIIKLTNGRETILRKVVSE